MPILRGAVTFTRFRVEHPEKPPSDVRRWFQRGLSTGVFEPIDKRADEERSAGFVELENKDSTEFSSGSLFHGERALFAWRQDGLKIPAAQLKEELTRWEKEFEGREGRRPARSEKKEMKGQLRHGLKMRATPLTRLHDLCWNLKTHELSLWTTSRKTVEEVSLAIETGFKVKLEPLNPAQLAVQAGLEEDALKPTAELSGVDGEEVAHG